MTISAYDLMEALQVYIERCDDEGIEPVVQVMTQPSHPIYGQPTGAAEVGDTFWIGAEMTGGYGDAEVCEELNGF
jgi:hypothetical protein